MEVPEELGYNPWSQEITWRKEGGKGTVMRLTLLLISSGLWQYCASRAGGLRHLRASTSFLLTSFCTFRLALWRRAEPSFTKRKSWIRDIKWSSWGHTPTKWISYDFNLGLSDFKVLSPFKIDAQDVLAEYSKDRWTMCSCIWSIRLEEEYHSLRPRNKNGWVYSEAECEATQVSWQVTSGTRDTRKDSSQGNQNLGAY